MKISDRIRKLGLVAATALVSINIWTGAPLFAVWVGSQVQGSSGLSMGSVFLVVVVLAALCSRSRWRWPGWAPL